MRANMPSVCPNQLLPEGLTAIIAGGYAACPALAADMDVWVQTDQPLALVRQQILNHLFTQNIPFVAQDSNDQHIVDGCGYDDMPVNIRKVAQVRFPSMIPIHVMVTDAPPVALLLAFDISTHQMAIGPDDEEIRGPEWTPLEVEPVIIRNHDQPKTLARLAKITARYAPLRAREANVQTR